MHIPDGFVSPAVAAGTGLVSVVAVGLALGKSKDAFWDQTRTHPRFNYCLYFCGTDD